MLSKGTALVTGSAIRLGREIALALARAGYNIALHYGRSASAAQQTLADIRALGVECDCFQLDLTDVSHIPDLIRDVHTRFPDLNVLINSASIYESGTIQESSVDIFDLQMAINLRAPFFLTQAFVSQVTIGNIINIVDSKVGFNQHQYASYLLTKKSLVELTKMSALEFAPSIRVNGVAPGVIQPAVTRTPEYIQWRVAGIPLQKQGDPAYISQAVLSLLDNEFITGQILTVDGGETLTNEGRNTQNYTGASPDYIQEE